MSYHRFFNVARLPVAGNGVAAANKGLTGDSVGASAPREGAFVTPQSLTTFLGASGVVALLWKIAGLLVTAWADDMRIAFICAALVGAALYYISESDPARGQITRREYVIDAIIGFLNVLVLFSAAIGGTAAVTEAVSSTGPAPIVVNQTE